MTFTKTGKDTYTSPSGHTFTEDQVRLYWELFREGELPMQTTGTFPEIAKTKKKGGKKKGY